MPRGATCSRPSKPITIVGRSTPLSVTSPRNRQTGKSHNPVSLSPGKVSTAAGMQRHRAGCHRVPCVAVVEMTSSVVCPCRKIEVECAVGRDLPQWRAVGVHDRCCSPHLAIGGGGGPQYPDARCSLARHDNRDIRRLRHHRRYRTGEYNKAEQHRLDAMIIQHDKTPLRKPGVWKTPLRIVLLTFECKISFYAWLSPANETLFIRQRRPARQLSACDAEAHLPALPAKFGGGAVSTGCSRCGRRRRSELPRRSR